MAITPIMEEMEFLPKHLFLKYMYNGTIYQEQTTQTISYKLLTQNMRKGETYNIYVDPKHPSVFILQKKDESGFYHCSYIWNYVFFKRTYYAVCNLPYILECDILLSPAVKSHVLPVKIPPPGLCLDSFLSLFSAFPGKIHGGKQHSRLIQDYRRP